MPMNRKPLGQRFTALVLAAALTTLSGVIPVLDLVVGDGTPAVEAEHHPGTHGFPHNHLICIQHQANQWVAGADISTQLVLATVLLPNETDPTPLFRQNQTLLPPARAPPLA
jgi:hypothetical protein